jgi:hypothetical protein
VQALLLESRRRPWRAIVVENEIVVKEMRSDDVRKLEHDLWAEVTWTVILSQIDDVFDKTDEELASASLQTTSTPTLDGREQIANVQ